MTGLENTVDQEHLKELGVFLLEKNYLGKTRKPSSRGPRYTEVEFDLELARTHN